MKRQISQVLRIHREPWRRPSNADVHPCLRLPETLGVIFDFINDRHTLVALARVCTCFHAIAVERIPQHINNIYELLMSLPPDLWRLRVYRRFAHALGRKLLPQVPQAPWALDFVREMSVDDWSILIARAKKVKTIGGFEKTQDPRTFRGRHLVPHQTVVNALTKCPVSVLFPNLESLRGQIPQFLLPKVLPPSLRHVDIYSLTEEVDGIPHIIMPSFPTCCPQLQSFKVTFMCDIISAMDNSRLFPHFVDQWSHLRSFTGPADEHVLRHFSRLQELDDLNLDLESDWGSHGLSQASHVLPRTRLRKVRSITCRSGSFESVIKVLEILFGFSDNVRAVPEHSTPIVQRFVVGCFPFILSSFPRLISTLVGLVSLETLEVFRINSLYGTWQFAMDTNSSVYELLRPLCVFPNLVDVRFPFVTVHRPSRGRISAAQLLDLVKAWPNLREIHVAKPGVNFTVLELAALRRYCPQLQSIPSASVWTDKHDIAAIAADPGVLERAGLA